MGACEHLLTIGHGGKDGDPTPNVPATEHTSGILCSDCHDEGYEAWAHLRMCLECGHVACCDSSPYRHASKHHETTGHPVMRSFEPGEAWRWCYLDRRLAN